MYFEAVSRAYSRSVDVDVSPFGITVAQTAWIGISRGLGSRAASLKSVSVTAALVTREQASLRLACPVVAVATAPARRRSTTDTRVMVVRPSAAHPAQRAHLSAGNQAITSPLRSACPHQPHYSIILREHRDASAILRHDRISAECQRSAGGRLRLMRSPRTASPRARSACRSRSRRQAGRRPSKFTSLVHCYKAPAVWAGADEVADPMLRRLGAERDVRPALGAHGIGTCLNVASPLRW